MSIKDKFTDLKFLVLWTCRFDPGSGHHIYIKGLRDILLSRPFLFWSAKTVVVCNSKKLFAAFLISYYGTESVSGAANRYQPWLWSPQQVHMCGKSVTPPPMVALTQANDPWRISAQHQVAA
ncbi:hypothetical protein VT47_13260 [Pseudomonas syringae pv. syringae]|nr:hypothetical protein VT47_13260 [Pseudomonas syringae pv. syringae]